jgi:hypothetical protein
MWAVDQNCPDFRVRTPTGAVGPGDLRGRWTALLHCANPGVSAGKDRLDRFATLGKRLSARDCRLVVALDAPDPRLGARLAQLPADAQAAVTVGTWDAPEPDSTATLFAVIDPAGTVRTLIERKSATPLPERTMLEEVDHVLARPVVACNGHTVTAADGYGCVEWYDYEANPPPAQAPH